MEPETLTFHPLDQFEVTRLEPSSWQMVLIWLEASVYIIQFSIVALMLMGFPLWRLLPTVGISKWLALVSVFPPFALILIWIVGFKTKVPKE